MAIIRTDSKHYKAIADAIRTKKETDATYRPEEMGEAILSIEGGTPDGTTLTVTFTETISYWDEYVQETCTGDCLTVASGVYAIGEDPLQSENATAFRTIRSFSVANVPIGSVVNIAITQSDFTDASAPTACTAMPTTFYNDEYERSGFAVTINGADARVNIRKSY